MKALIMVLVLVLLAACVQFDEEIEAPVAEPAEEEPVEEPKPTALAPLPESNDTKMSKTVGPAVVPKSVPANSSTQPQKQTVASGWTTESLSIAEGETKFVYIDEPAQP